LRLFTTMREREKSKGKRGEDNARRKNKMDDDH
jgi:hypothetical protein